MKFQVTREQLNDILRKVSSVSEADVTTQLYLDDLIVIIKKWGTSTFKFSITHYPNEDYLELNLVNEDIAWLHKSKVPKVKEAILKLVSDCGGKILSL